MKIDRYYTKEGKHPFDLVKWKLFNAEIKEADGNITFKQDNVEFPEFWSQQAVNICASKYFYGPLDSPDREHSLKQVATRIAATIARWGQEGGYFDNDAVNAHKFEMELIDMIINQRAAFNSPVWFNVGNPYSKPQISACYIIGVEDNMDSILEAAKTEGQIFKYGSGAGSNRSNIRSSKETLSGGGKPSGPESFMEIYDTVAKSIKSGGKTRRAAKMEALNIDHGDIVEFINSKAEQEKLVHILIENGYSAKYDDPKGAYSIAKFQQSNRSVSVFNNFMECWLADEDYYLLARQGEYSSETIGHYWPVKKTPQGEVVSINEQLFVKQGEDYKRVLATYKAKDLMREIATAAWKSADPGVQFQDIMNEWNTCPNSGRITATNPCSEYVFLDDTSCNLASLRLGKFLRADGSIDIDGIEYTTQLLTIAQDIMIDFAHFPTEKIAEKTRAFRALGIGFADLGGLLVRRGIAYDSCEARALASSLTALITASAYLQSAVMAKEIAPFKEFAVNREPMINVVEKHFQATKNHLKDSSVADRIMNKATDIFDQALNMAFDHGFRNSQVTVLAPTGTIGFVMDCDTTGVEPMFGLIVYKQLAGGGFMKLVNKAVAEGLISLGYKEGERTAIINHIAETGSINRAPFIREDHLPVFATAVQEDNMIGYMGHIKMMAAIQPFLSGAISKTVNLPNSATVEDIENIYVESWKMGLKCIALYRDGCKSSQPLSVKKEEKKKVEDKPAIEEKVAPKRNRMKKTRNGRIHKFSIGGHEGYLIIGTYEDGTPGELFVKMNKEGSTISGMMDAWSITVSMLMQVGYPLNEIIAKFENIKFEPAGWTDNADIRTCTSPIDYVVKYIKKEFVESESNIKKLDEEIKESALLKAAPAVSKNKIAPLEVKSTGETCIHCGNPTQKTGTCSTCTVCGETTGCG